MKPKRYFDAYELIRDLSYNNPDAQMILYKMMNHVWSVPSEPHERPIWQSWPIAMQIQYLLQYAETGDDFLNLYERAIGI